MAPEMAMPPAAYRTTARRYSRQMPDGADVLMELASEAGFDVSDPKAHAWWAGLTDNQRRYMANRADPWPLSLRRFERAKRNKVWSKWFRDISPGGLDLEWLDYAPGDETETEIDIDSLVDTIERVGLPLVPDRLFHLG